jgi:hypothetical protein
VRLSGGSLTAASTGAGKARDTVVSIRLPRTRVAPVYSPTIVLADGTTSLEELSNDGVRAALRRNACGAGAAEAVLGGGWHDIVGDGKAPASGQVCTLMTVSLRSRVRASEMVSVAGSLRCAGCTRCLLSTTASARHAADVDVMRSRVLSRTPRLGQRKTLSSPRPSRS